MGCGLHTTAQMAVGGLKALLVDQQEALEVVGQSAIEHPGQEREFESHPSLVILGYLLESESALPRPARPGERS